MFKMNRIKNNGRVSRQRFSVSEMEDFEDQNSDHRRINLEDICGCWYSRELCPTLLIYKDHNHFMVALLHTDELGQVQPEICKIENGREICTREGIVRLSLDENSYQLFLAGIGEYYKL